MRYLFSVVFACVAAFLYGQQNRSFSESIRTVESIANGDRMAVPVIELGKGEITVSFDEMSHSHTRYLYSLQHCDRYWAPSESLFESDFMTGTNLSAPIEDCSYSPNTSNAYTHYSVSFPNENVSMLISGNYRVNIYDEQDTNNPVATAFFSVVENRFDIAGEVTANTDIDSRESHQQLSLRVNFKDVVLHDPAREVFVRVLQNNRYDIACDAPEATFIDDHGMNWEHCRQLIFPAGNEFRKFEIPDIHRPTLGIDKVRWFEPFYHAFLYTDRQHTNYIFTSEKNGKYVLRNATDENPDTRSEYILVHFSLEKPLSDGDNLSNGDFYVCGAWNAYNFLPEYRMHYNAQDSKYEATILLKQGYYNYTYLFVEKDATAGSMSQSEGDFFQTENEYNVYVYAHLQGERYDRLMSCRTINYGTSQN